MPQQRAVAARLISDVLQHHGSLSTLLPRYTDDLPPAMSPFVKELSYGVLRWYFQLHAALQSLLEKPLRKKDLDVYALLLIGCYQLTHLRTPAHAALAQTVEACRCLNKNWATRLVNGVLRQYARNEETILASLASHEQLAHPQWLAERLQRAWPREYRAIMQSNNQRPPQILRVNCLQIDRDGYLRRLEQQGIAAQACRYAPQAVLIENPVNVEALPGFSAGLVSVQDEGAQLAAPLLKLQAALKVLDACAAPGGKTCHMLELQPELEVLSIDNNARRLLRVRDNLQRLQLRAEVLEADVTQPETWRAGQLFDRILLDVPCSATGVISRNPDIKFLRQDSDIAPLERKQATLLRCAWRLLKPGGKLLYSTCSILPNENEDIIAVFVAQQGDASEELIAAAWGLARRYGRQLLPQANANDGFYYALLNKKLTDI